MNISITIVQDASKRGLILYLMVVSLFVETPCHQCKCISLHFCNMAAEKLKREGGERREGNALGEDFRLYDQLPPAVLVGVDVEVHVHFLPV